MLKLLRNHFIDDGIRLPTGNVITTEVIQKVLKADSSEMRICPRLHSMHLEVKGRERMKVSYAAQLFSTTTTKAITQVDANEKEAGNFVQLVNDCFDVLNSRIPFNEKNKLKSGYGLYLDEQNKLLKEFQSVCYFMRFGKKKILLPFQRGYLMNIIALKGLYSDVQQYGVHYILTSRLNQDALVSYFSQIRGLGTFYDHPLPNEVKNRIRLLLLGVNVNDILMSRGANVQVETDNDDQGFITTNLFDGITSLVDAHANDEIVNRQNIQIEDNQIDDDNEALLTLDNTLMDESDTTLDCASEAFRYFAGNLAFRGKAFGCNYGYPAENVCHQM